MNFHPFISINQELIVLLYMIMILFNDWHDQFHSISKHYYLISINKNVTGHQLCITSKMSKLGKWRQQTFWNIFSTHKQSDICSGWEIKNYWTQNKKLRYIECMLLLIIKVQKIFWKSSFCQRFYHLGRNKILCSIKSRLQSPRYHRTRSIRKRHNPLCVCYLSVLWVQGWNRFSRLQHLCATLKNSMLEKRKWMCED